MRNKNRVNSIETRRRVVVHSFTEVIKEIEVHKAFLIIDCKI